MYISYKVDHKQEDVYPSCSRSYIIGLHVIVMERTLPLGNMFKCFYCFYTLFNMLMGVRWLMLIIMWCVFLTLIDKRSSFSFLFFCQRQRNLSFKLLFLYPPKEKKEKKVVISIYSGSMSDPLASSLPLMSACACTGVHDN